MKHERLVQHLADMARRFGYTVRTEEGNFRGGQCVFDEQKLVILNRRMTMDERADLLARILVDEDLDSVFVLPEVRRFVEKFLPDERGKAAG